MGYGIGILNVVVDLAVVVVVVVKVVVGGGGGGGGGVGRRNASVVWIDEKKNPENRDSRPYLYTSHHAIPNPIPPTIPTGNFFPFS